MLGLQPISLLTARLVSHPRVPRGLAHLTHSFCPRRHWLTPPSCTRSPVIAVSCSLLMSPAISQACLAFVAPADGALVLRPRAGLCVLPCEVGAGTLQTGVSFASGFLSGSASARSRERLEGRGWGGRWDGFAPFHVPAVSLSRMPATAFTPAVGSYFSPVYYWTRLITPAQRCQHRGAEPPSQRSASRLPRAFLRFGQPVCLPAPPALGWAPSCSCSWCRLLVPSSFQAPCLIDTLQEMLIVATPTGVLLFCLDPDYAALGSEWSGVALVTSCPEHGAELSASGRWVAIHSTGWHRALLTQFLGGTYHPSRAVPPPLQGSGPQLCGALLQASDNPASIYPRCAISMFSSFQFSNPYGASSIY